MYFNLLWRESLCATDFYWIMYWLLLCACWLAAYFSFLFLSFYPISFHVISFHFISSIFSSFHGISFHFLSFSFPLISFPLIHLLSYPFISSTISGHVDLGDDMDHCLNVDQWQKKIRERIKGGQRWGRIKGKAKESPKSMSGWNSWLAVLHHWGHQ